MDSPTQVARVVQNAVVDDDEGAAMLPMPPMGCFL